MILLKEYQTQLAKLLLEKNPNFTENQAQTWVELLWDDFETTYAKAGREYKGSEMTERIVRQWIENHGDKLHDFIARNPKYKQLLEQSENNN